MKEVKLIFEDYQENISAWKVYEERSTRDEAIKVKTICYEYEKVDGGKVIKEDTKMAHRVDRLNSNANAIKRIKADLKPFVVTMNKISQDDKRLLTSHYIKGKSVNEIAKELDLSVTATRSRFNKAEIKFLKIYKHYSEAH